MEIEIGRVTHYYNHLNVAAITLNSSLKLGDNIHILGHVTDFTQRVGSMEVEHHTVVWVRPGEEVAVKVAEPAREHDMVYKVTEEALEPHPA